MTEKPRKKKAKIYPEKTKRVRNPKLPVMIRVYESDLLKFNDYIPRSKRIAREIAVNAVHAEANNFQNYLKSSIDTLKMVLAFSKEPGINQFDVNEYINKLIENEEDRRES